MIPLAMTNAMAYAGMAAALIVGFAIHAVITLLVRGTAKAAEEKITSQARLDAEKIKNEAEVAARDRAVELKEEAEQELQAAREEVNQRERRLDKREDQIERKQELLDKKQEDIKRTENDLADRREKLKEKEKKLEGIYQQEVYVLESVSGLDKGEAKDLLLRKLEKTLDVEMSEFISKKVDSAKEEAEKRARDVIVTTIQRTAAEHTAENVVSTVDLPSDDMKGRIIGREGRNIRSFEKATGVDVIVDDTPGVVIVSGFDPVRRELARMSMIKLVSDGRIHPARIEEVVESTAAEVEQIIDEAGREACVDLGMHDVNPKIQTLLGRLQFRTSYGQNILNHSIEVANLLSVMATELNLDPLLAKRCGLLHDIGKAIDHEMEGGHPEIGAEFAKRHGECATVINAIAAHHHGCEATSAYPVLVASADAISAARPGARRETLERYIKRLERLEEVAGGFDGVEQAYAIQAGREVRVIVKAEAVSDERMVVLGREIANAIEAELRYPGEIKVTMIRETRVVEFAR